MIGDDFDFPADDPFDRRASDRASAGSAFARAECKPPVKRLVLLRHAKTEPLGPGGDDRARPLTAGGHAAALEIGRLLIGTVPDFVLCSPARRTRETLTLALEALPRMPRIEFDEALYLAPPFVLMDRIADLPVESACVWIVGHNPGLHETVRELLLAGDEAGDGIVEAGAALEARYPPGSFAVFAAGVESWRRFAAAPPRLAAGYSPSSK